MESGKIFVGGLDWSTEADGLKGHFSSFGEVTDCVVMRTPGGKSRGFGFVTFADADAVTVVLNKKHSIDGRAVDAKPCTARGTQNGSSSKTQRPGFSGKTTKIFVGGLPNDADEESLKGFFSSYGKVTDVVIMMDSLKQRSRGFGFLTFDSEDAVDKAVQEHYTEFQGRKIEMKRAEPRQGNNNRRQNFNEQGWGDGWNQNQSYGSYGQSNSYGGYGNQGFDQSWGGQQQQQPYGGQGWGQNQGYNSSYGGQGYNQGYGQNYGGSQGYGGNQGYSGGQSSYAGSQSYGAGQSSYGGSQGYSGGQGGYSGGSQGGYSGGSQGGYGSGSQDGYGGSGGGKVSSSSGGSQSYHPYKR